MNLLLVTVDASHIRRIVPQVMEEMQELGGYRCRLVHDYAPNLKHRLWTLGLPTTVVSFCLLRWFNPPWARVWSQVDLDKIQEYRVLEHAGLPVPKWEPLTEGAEPDLSSFGEHVVVKPASGIRGALVRVMRRNKVRWERQEIRCFNVVSEAMVVQEYVHTGPRPVSFRVATVFGEPIYALRITASRNRPPITFNGTNGSRAFDGKTIVASSKGCTMDEEVPQEVVELARRAHTAFPTVPVLGSDIVRDCRTGQLYVLEVNAVGSAFHLDSIRARQFKEQFGIDLSLQFGGVNAVARGIHRRLCQANEKSSRRNGIRIHESASG